MRFFLDQQKLSDLTMIFIVKRDFMIQKIKEAILQGNLKLTIITELLKEIV